LPILIALYKVTRDVKHRIIKKLHPHCLRVYDILNKPIPTTDLIRLYPIFLGDRFEEGFSSLLF
jgi:hypothetical protein